MAEVFFSSEEMRKLLHNKFIVIIGDSVQRGLYKDLVHFSMNDSYVSNADLKNKGELTFVEGDELHEGGRLDEMNNNTSYREIRNYQTDTLMIRFYFITRVYNEYFETIVQDLDPERSPVPDVIIMNSCMWDMARYGPRWLDHYKDNMDRMLNAIKPVITEDTLFIWLTCMPVGKKVRGGFLIQSAEWKKNTIRLDVLEANFFASQAVIYHGFDVFDMNYHFRGLSHLRTSDDIHWLPQAHRRMTNLILMHICDQWGVKQPRRMIQAPVQFKNPLPPAQRQHRRSSTVPFSWRYQLLDLVPSTATNGDKNNNDRGRQSVPSDRYNQELLDMFKGVQKERLGRRTMGNRILSRPPIRTMSMNEREIVLQGRRQISILVEEHNMYGRGRMEVPMTGGTDQNAGRRDYGNHYGWAGWTSRPVIPGHAQTRRRYRR